MAAGSTTVMPFSASRRRISSRASGMAAASAAAESKGRKAGARAWGPVSYTHLGQRTTVNASQLNESTVGSDTTVGPFTYVRPGCTIGDHCRVGDFVEVKNSVIGDGTKISHLRCV